MPPLQIVNTEAAQTPNRAEENLKQLFSKMGEQYREKENSEALAPIWEQYLENRNDADNYLKTQVALEKANISPTKRLETQAKLNEMQKIITEKDKALNASAKKESGKQGAREALNTVNRQRQILETGHLGPKIAFVGTGRKAGSTVSPEGIKLRAEYKRLGKSLIQQSTNIPIRNRQEFETLAADLYDPELKQEEIKGILDAMERIIKSSIGEEEGSPTTQAKERPPLSTFRK